MLSILFNLVVHSSKTLSSIHLFLVLIMLWSGECVIMAANVLVPSKDEYCNHLQSLKFCRLSSKDPGVELRLDPFTGSDKSPIHTNGSPSVFAKKTMLVTSEGRCASLSTTSPFEDFPSLIQQLSGIDLLRQELGSAGTRYFIQKLDLDYDQSFLVERLFGILFQARFWLLSFPVDLVLLHLA